MSPNGTPPPPDLGALIADLRTSLGWSQSRLASELGQTAGHDTVTREQVSRWEHGRRTPAAFWLRHLATVLQVPIELLEKARVDRRSFLTTAAGTAIAPMVASDLIERGFAEALRGRAPSVEDWEQAVETYGRDYMTQGAAEIQKRLSADLVVLQQQLDAPCMWATAARLATLYAKTFPGSDGAKAVTWYRHAAAFADRSGDEPVRVWVRGRAAIALGYEGAALGVADTLAEQAIAMDDRPSLGRVNAVMGKAHVAAQRGDHDGARTLVEEGRRVFDVAGSDDAESDYAVPWWRFNVFASLLAARMGDERLAEEVQAEAAANLPASLPRFKTHLEMHRGLMLTRVGDRAGGAAHARAALEELPPEKHSLTLRMLMEEIDAA
ncbi:helix-turn-helix domain-containing protein [Streptomonospora wellingtoniae]|uniref:Helix-turn-helix transcriptional regulator n=1 Tax=Streptomonospora wellingtoniae TaxID=3075544 RepID=A0ABU2KUA9_9ACTN|nr:helix-turn-helix transcriptional regulator [Streptomonospora sp. DSM 45055]MDT0302879.1 helix-turn-helix transcriptional regulator [Streptomonospora sp. DSM 45055]